MRTSCSIVLLAACLAVRVPESYAQSSGPPEFKMPHSVDGKAAVLLGFIANGTKEDLERVMAAATEAKFPAKGLPGPKGAEVMVVFGPNSDAQAALAFYQRVKSPEFSTLEIQPILTSSRPSK